MLMNITGPRFATHGGLLQNITVSVRCHLCGSLTVKTKKIKKILFPRSTVKVSLLRSDSIARRRFWKWFALRSVRDLKRANPFLSVQKAKYRQKMTSGRHMGLTKHHSYPTRSLYSRAHRAETWADVFQALPRQISGYKCLAVTHSGGSSPVCLLKHAILTPLNFPGPIS